jgi:hypothetical protein
MIAGSLPQAIWPAAGEDLSAEFVKLLVAAQEGGSCIAECFLVARQAGKGDEFAWHFHLNKLAETNRARGDTALASGHIATARRNWLRAINYYNASALPLDSADERRWSSVVAMQECARRFLRHRSPAGEVVTLPWLRDHSLQGYFLAAPSVRGPAPTVICLGEPGHRKEEFLFKLAPHALERGLSMLAIDLLGERRDDFLGDLVARPDFESWLSPVVDYLSLRNDVDDSRIAVLADRWSSSFVARAVASEPRLAAAVCDGGLWDLHERAFLAERANRRDAGGSPKPVTSRIARNIKCPVLITLGENGWLKPDHTRQMVRQLRTDGLDATLRLFKASETGAEQGHADNPGLANEHIFDWLASRLDRRAAEQP